MSLKAGAKLLGAPYKLGALLSEDERQQTWTCSDDYGETRLLKAWGYEGDTPDDLQRALWDYELRTLYRLGSSPGADETILVIKDAGLDRSAQSFVMVLEAQPSSPAGYKTLSSVLSDRAQFPWFSNRDVSARRDLWQGLLRLADGLRLLHHQHVLHRNLGLGSVYFDPSIGISSFRLGGFEWSVRLASPANSAPPQGWSTPPELFESSASGYGPDTDWFGFGMLAARCLLNLEPHRSSAPPERHRRVLKAIERTDNKLSDLERSLLLRLLAVRPEERLSRGHEVRTALQNLIVALGRGPDPDQETRPLVVVINPAANDRLLESALEGGFLPDPNDPRASFNPKNPHHTAGLTHFVQEDLQQSQIYAVPDRPHRILVGGRLQLLLVPFAENADDGEAREPTWDLAFCPTLTELRWSQGGSSCIRLPEGIIAVRTKRQVLQDATIRAKAQPWSRFLPTIDRARKLRVDLARFHDFIRCTNQLELLIRDAEIFAYEVTEKDNSDPGQERITVREIVRERRVPDFCKVDGGMLEFVDRERESNKPDSNLWLLVPPGGDSLGLRLAKTDCWEVRSTNADANTIELVRPKLGGKRLPAPDKGYLRAFGMFGQLTLIRRRKDAIDRLGTHSFLLRSLCGPGQVYMDSGPVPLAVPIDRNKVDSGKQSVVRDILAVRPIYALQGPPGTGKTTLVAHLLRQILEDDPVAQVLITAQAHGAVDVLRQKVEDVFAGVTETRKPLAVRLERRTDDSLLREGSVEHVALGSLLSARERLEETNHRTPLQEEWLRTAVEMINGLRTGSREGPGPDYCEVVRRGANLTYSTTSDAGLAALAEITQLFDWAILEEAGKAHGFDVALPLQAGHRWLLIGDHKQLPPYRFKDYRDSLSHLDEAVAALERLPDKGGGLLDRDWISRWRDLPPDDREDFIDYCKHWLTVFQRVFEHCKTASGSDRLTEGRPLLDELAAPAGGPGAAAGMLQLQYRMHPKIAELISESFYDSKLSTSPDVIEKVQHPFTSPLGIAGRAIVWLDLPWAKRDHDYREIGPLDGRPRYTNPREAELIASFVASLRGASPDADLELVVLSPYYQQVNLLNGRFGKMALPPGVILKKNLRVLKATTEGVVPGRLAYTVDSFQGNEADIVVVSLVRNNERAPATGLGFLVDAARANVLLSRAERLLVLVGSWEFFQHQLSTTYLGDKHETLWHWKKAMDLLGEWATQGHVLRLGAQMAEEA